MSMLKRDMSSVKCPWDMLNNFCFHVYAQKSLFIVENVNGFFFTSSSSPLILEFIELVPSLKSTFFFKSILFILGKKKPRSRAKETI